MFTKEQRDALINNEKGKSSESYFSSKDNSDNYFELFTGKEVRVVGLDPRPEQDGIGAHNRVLFSDGHVMSTSRFFSARGIQWPVGGNQNKVVYLIDALDKGIALVVTPQKVTLGEPFLTMPAKKKNETKAETEERLKTAREKTREWRKNPTKDESGQLVAPEGFELRQTPTFYFEDVTFPSLSSADEEA